MLLKTTKEVKTAIRSGPYAWPGGYPLFFIADDGDTICYRCARNEWRYICDSITHNIRDGWMIIANEINWECDQLFCANCNERIESAYGKGE